MFQNCIFHLILCRLFFPEPGAETGAGQDWIGSTTLATGGGNF